MLERVSREYQRVETTYNVELKLNRVYGTLFSCYIFYYDFLYGCL